MTNATNGRPAAEQYSGREATVLVHVRPVVESRNRKPAVKEAYIKPATRIFTLLNNVQRRTYRLLKGYPYVFGVARLVVLVYTKRKLTQLQCTTV